MIKIKKGQEVTLLLGISKYLSVNSECFQKVTTMKKYSSFYLFQFSTFTFVILFAAFYVSLVELPGQYLTQNWMQLLFSHIFFRF